MNKFFLNILKRELWVRDFHNRKPGISFLKLGTCFIASPLIYRVCFVSKCVLYYVVAILESFSPCDHSVRGLTIENSYFFFGRGGYTAKVLT